jgi:D-arabinitol 2-dehydrogenase
MAEGLVEAGGKVHCLDRAAEPSKAFEEARMRIDRRSGGAMEYHQVDVTQDEALEKCIEDIAAEKQRLDGLIAGVYTFFLARGVLRILMRYVSRWNPTSYICS